MNRYIRPRFVWFLSVVLTVPASGFAQNSGGDPRVLVADSLHRSGELNSALGLFEEILEGDPDHVTALWKAAREAIAVGVMLEGTDAQNEFFDRGIGFAERALALVPTDFRVEFWLVAAQGLRAKHAAALLAARLATSVYERSHSLLGRDSLHSGVNHALGALNVEVMKLSRLKRFIAVTILGNRAFRDTSWNNAELYLVRALESDPSYAIARLDLGRAYFYQDKFRAARIQFEGLLNRSIVDPTDVAFRDEARRYLQRIP